MSQIIPQEVQLALSNDIIIKAIHKLTARALEKATITRVIFNQEKGEVAVEYDEATKRRLRELVQRFNDRIHQLVAHYKL